MSQHAVEIVESSDNLVITEGVIGETAFVLSSVYRMPREEIVDWLMDLTGRSNVAVYAIDKDLALQGLRMCRPSGRVSIADAMIWAAARSAGANHLHIRPVVSW